MTKEIITTDKLPASKNPYSHAIRCGGLIYVTGQIGKGADGKLVNEFKPQVAQMMDNLKLVVEAAGKTMDDIVKIKVSLTDITRMAEFNEVYRTYFSESYPTRAAVEVRRLGLDANVEVEAVVDGS